MKKVVVCRFNAYRASEEQPYNVVLCAKDVALSKENFEGDRRAFADRLLKEYNADEVSCRELGIVDLYEGV